jgi:cytochrome c oxidase assembly factor CtaG
VSPAPSAFAWHFHLAWPLAVAALVGSWAWGTRRLGCPPTRRQQVRFALGALLLLGAVTWPLADLAAQWLLSALVAQRLLLTLAVPPLLVLGTPRPLLDLLTRPAPVDAVLRVVVRPIPAVLIVTVVAVATLTTGAVTLAARSEAARVALELLVLASGFVLWAPVLTDLPGTPHMSLLGRGGYLVVQSVVPSFLSVVWIFARHPLYPTFTHAGRVLAMSPLLDQQLSGFLAKLSTIAVLWTVAFVLMTRAKEGDKEGHDPDPLLWSDVQRELERAERRGRRHTRWPGSSRADSP